MCRFKNPLCLVIISSFLPNGNGDKVARFIKWRENEMKFLFLLVIFFVLCFTERFQFL